MRVGGRRRPKPDLEPVAEAVADDSDLLAAGGGSGGWIDRVDRSALGVIEAVFEPVHAEVIGDDHVAVAGAAGRGQRQDRVVVQHLRGQRLVLAEDQEGVGCEAEPGDGHGGAAIGGACGGRDGLYVDLVVVEEGALQLGDATATRDDGDGDGAGGVGRGVDVQAVLVDKQHVAAGAAVEEDIAGHVKAVI